MVLKAPQRLQKVTCEQASGCDSAEVRQPATETFQSNADGRDQTGKSKGSEGKKKVLSRSLMVEETSLISQCNSFNSRTSTLSKALR